MSVLSFPTKHPKARFRNRVARAIFCLESAILVSFSLLIAAIFPEKSSIAIVPFVKADRVIMRAVFRMEKNCAGVSTQKNINPNNFSALKLPSLHGCSFVVHIMSFHR